MDQQPELFEADGTPIGLAKVEIKPGAQVRLYEADDSYHDGEIMSVENGIAVVDFYDWVQAWPVTDLRIYEYAMLAFTIIPASPGQIIADYRTQQAA